MQEDLEKLFDAINEAKFEKSQEKGKSNDRLITEIMTTLGVHHEVIQLLAPVKCEGNIEFWLLAL